MIILLGGSSARGSLGLAAGFGAASSSCGGVAGVGWAGAALGLVSLGASFFGWPAFAGAVVIHNVKNQVCTTCACQALRPQEQRS